MTSDVQTGPALEFVNKLGQNVYHVAEALESCFWHTLILILDPLYMMAGKAKRLLDITRRKKVH